MHFSKVRIVGFFLLAGFAGIFIAVPAAAQEQRAPDGQVMPDLAPREFEIRGELEIAFPSLRRQPLIGFNPPPEIYRVPEDRRPFTEEYRQAAADLGTSPLGRPTPPGVGSFIGGPGNRGHVELGMGRYLTRAGRAWLNFPLASRTAFQASLDYEGSNGHRPFPANQDLTAPYESFDGSVGVVTSGRSVTAGLILDGHSDSYRMFGAEPRITPNVQLYRPQPERMGYGMGATVEFSTKPITGAPWVTRVRYGTARYETDIFHADETEDPRFQRTERRLDVHSDFQIPYGIGRLRIDGDLSVGGLDTDAFIRGDQLVYDVGGDLQFLYRNVFHVTLGGRMLGFSTSDNNGVSGTAFYPMPSGSVDLYPFQALHLYFRQKPHVVTNTLTQVMRNNPYVLDEPILRPDVAIVDAQGGASLYVRPLRISGHTGLQIFRNLLFFEPTAENNVNVYDRGFFDALYGPARVLHFGGDVTMYFSSVFTANVQAKLRHGRLTGRNADAVIPHYAPVIGSTALSYRFAENRALLRLTGEFEGRRFADRAETERLDPFFSLNFYSSYDFTRGLGAFLQLENASGNQYQRWANYPQPTWIVMGGVRLNW